MDLLDQENLLFSILVFLDNDSRQTLMYVNKAIFERLSTEESFQWRLEQLEKEHGVYFGGQSLGSTRMRQLFLEQFRLRHMWEPRRARTVQDTFQTKTSVRFKPLMEGETTQSTPTATATLPLSQRLTLLRISYNLSSNREALKLLGKLGGIGCFANDSTLLGYSGDASCTVTNTDEDDTGSPNRLPTTTTMRTGIRTIDSTHNRVVVVDKTQGLKEFPFDTVLPKDATQKETYSRIGHSSVRNVLCGYNATILMYGQTGSGKTHTMIGSPTEQGLLPRACQELFRAVQQREHSFDIQSRFSVSYVEIFGNEVTDLLRNGQKVAHNMAAAHRMVMEGRSSNDVDSLQDAMALIEQGEGQKKVAATAMNERSSRAHSLFILNLRQTCGKVTRSSRLILGDLGGAEQLKKSQQVGSTDSDWKDRTREAIQINLGLLALKSCVDALNRRASHVPYGASKLTMMLSEGLAKRNTRTHIVVCASQDPQHATESLASLQFAQACSGIQYSKSKHNNARSTDQLLRELLEDLDDRIEACRSAIQRDERWVTVQEERPDGDTGEMEVYTRTKLSGAEHHNQELEALLRRRGELTGTDRNALECLDGYPYNAVS